MLNYYKEVYQNYKKKIINYCWFKKIDIKLTFSGGGSGIGRQTCLDMANEGALVVAADIHEDSAQDSVNRMEGMTRLFVCFKSQL